MKFEFPEIVTSLPEADIPIGGLKAFVLQGHEHQVLFMQFSQAADVGEHSHEAQWGVVLEGEMELTVDGRVRVLKKGDVYFIPKGVKHAARISEGYADLTLFNERDRYDVKEKG